MCIRSKTETRVTGHVLRNMDDQLGNKGESSFLQLFWDLASVNDAEQLRAGKEIILALKEKQAEVEEGLCPGLEYSLQRLVKGLASHRKGARQGYFTVLTEVLSLFHAIPLSRVYELIHTHLENVGKAQEEKGAYFGRAFALMALIQSGRLTDTTDLVSVVKQLRVCAERKFYLQEFVAVAVCRLLGSVPEGVVRVELVPVLGLGGGWKTCTPETLYVMLELNKKYEKRGWFKQLLKESWQSKSIISRDNFEKMVAPLLGSSSAHPRLHCVWPLVLEAVRDKGKLEAFWNTVVDGSLCVSSHERKYLALQLLEFLLPSLIPSEVPVVFSPTLLRCLVNHASSEKNYLHAAATHLLAEVVSCAKAAPKPDLPVAILLHLQARTASRFDQLSATKTVENILENLGAEGIQQLLERLQQLFCEPSSVSGDKTSADTLSDAHSVQLWVADQIQGLVRNGKLARANSWLLGAAKFLFVHAFFTVKKPCPEIPELAQVPSAAVEAAVRESCVQRFNSVLIDLSKVEKAPEGGAAGLGHSRRSVAPRGLFLPDLADFAVHLLSMKQGVAVREPFSDEDHRAWESASTLVASLRNQDELSPEGTAFLLLLSALTLQLFPERNRSREAIEELCVCHEEMQLSHSRTPSRKKHRAMSSGPGWVEVFTDTLLGFLSQPSQLWRSVVDQAFRLVTHCITPAALELVLKVLEPQSKDDLMETEAVVGGVSEDESSEGGEGEEGEEDVGEEDEGEGDEGEGEEVDAALRAAVKQALGTAAVDSDDEDSQSVSSFDDDAMMAIDEALAAAFRSRRAERTGKKQKKDEKKSVMHFKLRVLDLVETFIRKETSNPLVLNLFVPLYQLIHSAHGKQDSAPLATRATGIYKNRLCHLKKYPKVGVDGDHTHSQLQQLLQCQYKGTALTAPLVTDGCMLLLRVLRGCGPPADSSPITTRAGRKRKLQEDQQATRPEHGLLNVAMVTEWFSDALHDFIVKKNSNVHHMLFTSYIKKYPSLAWLLAPRMVEDITTAGNNFRKVQVYEMLSLLLSQHSEEEVLRHQLPTVAPPLQACCLTELAAAEQRPAKLTRLLLQLLGKLASLLKSHQELLPLLEADTLVQTIQQLTGSPTVGADVRREGERVIGVVRDEDQVAVPLSKRRKRAKHRKANPILK